MIRAARFLAAVLAATAAAGLGFSLAAGNARLAAMNAVTAVIFWACWAACPPGRRSQ